MPAAWMTPRSKLDRAEPAAADKTGLPALAPREREVALALAEGLSRAHVAERMRLSVHTVSALARRVYRKLGVSSQAALAAGVRREQLIWDPGLGFAKTTEQNLELLRGLDQLRARGIPLLVGPSRKRFIGAVLDEPRPKARLWGTAAVCAQAIAKGADVLRVHDVAPIAQVARMSDALWRG